MKRYYNNLNEFETFVKKVLKEQLNKPTNFKIMAFYQIKKDVENHSFKKGLFSKECPKLKKGLMVIGVKYLNRCLDEIKKIGKDFDCHIGFIENNAIEIDGNFEIPFKYLEFVNGEIYE